MDAKFSHSHASLQVGDDLVSRVTSIRDERTEEELQHAELGKENLYL